MREKDGYRDAQKRTQSQTGQAVGHPELFRLDWETQGQAHSRHRTGPPNVLITAKAAKVLQHPDGQKGKK